jgi:hypothetical protein
MMSDRASLLTWLRNQVLVSRFGGRVVKVDLAHISVEGKLGQEIQSYEVREESPPDSWFEETVDAIILLAEGDAKNLGSVQKYALRIFREKDPSRSTARMIHRVQGADSDEDISGFDSEPSTPKGLLTQLMRHNEASQRALVASLQTIMVTMQRTMARLAEQNDKLQTDRMDSMHIMEEMMSAKLERELAADIARQKQATMGELAKEVKLLAPALINRLTGHETLPAPDTKALAVSRFVESLTSEQKADLAKGLKPDQQIALLEIMQGMQTQT